MPAVSFSLARILGSWGGWRRTDQTSLSRRHRHLSHFQHEASQRACAIPPSPTLTMIRRLVNLLAVLLCLLVAPNQIVEAKKQRNAPHEHKVSRPSVLMPSRLMTCWPSFSAVSLHANAGISKLLPHLSLIFYILSNNVGQADALQSRPIRCAQARSKG